MCLEDGSESPQHWEVVVSDSTAASDRKLTASGQPTARLPRVEEQAGADSTELDEVEEMLVRRHQARKGAGEGYAMRMKGPVDEASQSKSFAGFSSDMRRLSLYEESQRSLQRVKWRTAPAPVARTYAQVANAAAETSAHANSAPALLGVKMEAPRLPAEEQTAPSPRKSSGRHVQGDLSKVESGNRCD
jgi:hypothetical protein